MRAIKATELNSTGNSVLNAITGNRHFKRYLWVLFSFLVFPLCAFAVDDVEQARNLLKKMALANREIDYRGVFTYEHAGALKSVRITHAVVDGLEYERLLYLNGPRREVNRLGVSPECRSMSDDFLAGVPVPSEFSSHLESNYELFLKGNDRVADRDVLVMHVVPKDAMRYGFIISVDRETGLLLQSLLVGTDRRVLERFQFVDIKFQLDPTELNALVEGSSSQGSARDSVSMDNCEQSIDPAIQWQANWMPAGFKLVKAEVDEANDVSMVYTDGLSFVSVFINSSQQTDFPPIQAQRGATVAQMAMLNHNGQEYQICVVGEVPAVAAEKIAQSVAPTF